MSKIRRVSWIITVGLLGVLAVAWWIQGDANSWLVTSAIAGIVVLGTVVGRGSDGVVRAERFELVDADGAVTAVLGVNEDGAGLSLMEAGNDEPRCSLQMGPRGPAVVLSDNDGKVRVRVEADVDGPYLALYDGKGTIRVGLAVPEDGPALDLYDDRAASRAAFFAHRSGSGVVVRDKRGKAIYARPSAKS